MIIFIVFCGDFLVEVVVCLGSLKVIFSSKKSVIFKGSFFLRFGGVVFSVSFVRKFSLEYKNSSVLVFF